jgi:hypothetical protein
MHMKNIVHGRSWRIITSSVLSAAAVAWSASPALAQHVGTNTTVDPYVLPSIADVKTISILTVKDLAAQNGYKMVGIPDGLGAFRNIELEKKPSDETGKSEAAQQFTLLMNHELGSAAGIVREHGSTGSFVSEWTIDRRTLEVIQGHDLTDSANKVYTWNGTSYVSGTTAWNRFCSADLPAVGALSYRNGTDLIGTSDQIFLNGEETDAGRAFAHIASGPNKGESWQLPRLGKVAFENVLASPYSQEKTIVVTMDDGSANTFLTTSPNATDFPSELHVYVGNKQNSGHPVEKAGLTNGKLHGVKVFLSDPNSPLAGEDNANGFGDTGSGYIGKAKFTLVEMGASGDVSAMNEVQLQQDDIDKKIFRMQRIEDGAWDPRSSHANDFYFVTTASFTSNSRLWRLRFDDIKQPEKGGTIEILLKGNEGQKMFDNMTIDGLGRILLQEDVGNQVRLGKIWLYGIDSGNLIEVAHHNEKFFLSGAANFLTQDEESSGIIDAAKILGDGWFLLDVQAHINISATDPELVERGQLLAMFIDPKIEASANSNNNGKGN